MVPGRAATSGVSGTDRRSLPLLHRRALLAAHRLSPARIRRLVAPEAPDTFRRGGLGAALPEAGRERQAVEVVCWKRIAWWEAQPLQHGMELAQVLGRMPGRALEQIVTRLRAAVVHIDHAQVFARRRPLEPAAEPASHEGAVAGDGPTVPEIARCLLSQPLRGEAPQVHAIGKGQAQAEHVIREVTDSAVALRGLVVQ